MVLFYLFVIYFVSLAVLAIIVAFVCEFLTGWVNIFLIIYHILFLVSVSCFFLIILFSGCMSLVVYL